MNVRGVFALKIKCSKNVEDFKMKMTLYKRNSVWWVTYMVKGKRYQQSCKTKSKEEAESWVRKITIAREAETYEEAVKILGILYGKENNGQSGVRLEDAWERYMRIAKATGRDAVSKRTIGERKNALNRFLAWRAKECPAIETVERVSGSLAARFAEELKKKGLKTQSRRNILGNLSTIWKLLEKISDNIRNPWDNLRPRDIDGVRGKAFSVEEERMVFAAAKKVGKDWLPICTIMRFTGLRYADVATLKWDEIQGDVIRRTPGKTRRHNISVAIPLVKQVVSALRTVSRVNEYVFPIHAECWKNKSGSKYKMLNFREVLKLAGLDGCGFTIHSFRHTAASRLSDAGVGIDARMRLLGHREEITAERYDHSEHLKELREAVEKGAQIEAGNSE